MLGEESEMIEYQKVLSGRRITIPEKLLKKHGLKEGDLITVEDVGDGILIIPVKIIPKHQWS